MSQSTPPKSRGTARASAQQEQLGEDGVVHPKLLSQLRGKMFKDLRKDVLTWSAESLDLARAYFHAPRQASPHQLEDKIYLPKASCSALELIEGVTQQWWASRAQLEPEQLGDALPHDPESPLKVLCGFYGRYLSASGYHMVLEFGPEGLTHVWRIDARFEHVAIKFPKDEDDFYDQMACYLDLRYGWRWHIHKYLQHQRLSVIEVENNYMIGVRLGEPSSQEDPAEREDPHLEDAFSRFDAGRFDTLEFLNGPDADELPFQEERYHTWLPESWHELLKGREHELFVLALSDDFFRAVEDMAEVRQVEAALIYPDSRPTLKLHRGPVELRRDFSLPYLKTLHSGRSFAEGAIDFVREDAERVRAASELYFGVSKLLSSQPAYRLKVKDGTLTISEGAELRAQVPLISWAEMGAFEGSEGPARLLTLLGYERDPDSGEASWRQPDHPLDRCPLCHEGAQVLRAVRPKPAQRGERQAQATFERGGAWGHYLLSCPHHRLPVTWSSPEQLEELISTQNYRRIEVRAEHSEGAVTLLWAEELAGLLLDSQGRESLRERGGLYARAIYPDLLALSMSPLEGAALKETKQRAELLARQLNPARMWPLELAVELK